jgi:hypothetical protein
MLYAAKDALPQQDITKENNLIFSYIPHDESSFRGCNLIINNAPVSTDLSITRGIEQQFYYELEEGNYQWKISCTDYNGNIGLSEQRNLTIKEENGNGDDDKDDEVHRFTLTSFNDCLPNWECSGWSECTDGIKTRACEDKNLCESSINKPSEITGCQSIKPILAESKIDKGFPWLLVLGIGAVVLFIIIVIVLIVKGI